MAHFIAGYRRIEVTDFEGNDALLHIFGRVGAASDFKQEYIAHNFNFKSTTEFC